MGAMLPNIPGEISKVLPEEVKGWGIISENT